MGTIKRIFITILQLVVTTFAIVVLLPIQLLKDTWCVINCVAHTIVWLMGYTDKYLVKELLKLRDNINGFAMGSIRLYEESFRGELFVKSIERAEKKKGNGA